MVANEKKSACLDLQERVAYIFPRVNYLAHIDDIRNIMYIETPKVACTSIKKFMMDQYVGEELHLESPGKVHQRDISPLKQLSSLSDAEKAVVWSEKYKRFSFVRNPFTRCLSGYLDKIITNEYERQRHLPRLGFASGVYPTFKEFLHRLEDIHDTSRDIHFMSQTELLMVDVTSYDYLGSFERFEENFSFLQRGFYGMKGPFRSYEGFGKHHASSANKKVLEHFGDEEADMVFRMYERDFEHFGYARDLMSCDAPPSNIGLYNGTSPAERN